MLSYFPYKQNKRTAELTQKAQIEKKLQDRRKKIKLDNFLWKQTSLFLIK